MMPLLSLSEIYDQIDRFDPIAYSKTRNYLNGHVSQLSPYVSRGLISVRDIYDRLISRGIKLYEMEAFVMELCWREHAQRIWQQHDPQIERRNDQSWIAQKSKIPIEILEANTGIDAIDKSLKTLKTTGYMHNHMRMYLAALMCNHYGCYWKTAAKWLHAQLCDCDGASNHLSWQWVCGANAPKIYYANQENINKYTESVQLNTPLDTSYELLPGVKLNATWKNVSLSFTPEQNISSLSAAKEPVLLYTPYNLDPFWRNNQKARRILFWDLDHWQDYPFNENIYAWINELARLNIPDIEIYIGKFKDLKKRINLNQTFAKEHPLIQHYGIQMDDRSWLFDSFEGQVGTFFNFWKKVHKHLSNEN